MTARVSLRQLDLKATPKQLPLWSAMLRRLITVSPVLAIFVLSGCTGHTTKADESAAVQHQGDRITVSPGSPLASRLQVEEVRQTKVHRQVQAPASVEAEPARFAKILPPLPGRVLNLFVHPGDAVKKGQELLSVDAPDFVSAQADYARARTVLAQAERALSR